MGDYVGDYVEKQDLRIKKTQRALTLAILALLEKQPFSKITVNDICAEAMISRSAFYTHFEDKYALLKASMLMLRIDLFPEHEERTLRERLIQLLGKIDENTRLFKNLLMAEVDVELMHMLRSSLHDDFTHLVKEHGITNLPGPIDLVSTYFSAGITSVIVQWIHQNKPYTVEQLADTLCALLPMGAQSIAH